MLRFVKVLVCHGNTFTPECLGSLGDGRQKIYLLVMFQSLENMDLWRFDSFFDHGNDWRIKVGSKPYTWAELFLNSLNSLVKIDRLRIC